MKRWLASCFALVLLSACGAAGKTSETPQQVVSTASQQMSHLQTAKFDLSATLLEQFPQSFIQSLGPQGAALANLSIDMLGNGEAKFPNEASMSMQVKTGSITVSTEMVVAAGKIYLKDPQTGSFSEVSTGNALLQFSDQTDPLSGATVLRAVQSIKDLGDTSLNGTAVHHYQIVPDKNKLADQASTPEAQQMLRTMLQNGSVQLEVWIGKDDHLLRRLKDDTDATIDLNQALQATGQALPSGITIPPGAAVHAVVHATITYHDFDSPVTVSVPPVSPS